VNDWRHPHNATHLLHFEDSVDELEDDPQAGHRSRVVGLPLILELRNRPTSRSKGKISTPQILMEKRKLINEIRAEEPYVDGIDLFAKDVDELELRSFVACPYVVVHSGRHTAAIIEYRFAINSN
jgi:hypothetical protein